MGVAIEEIVDPLCGIEGDPDVATERLFYLSDTEDSIVEKGARDEVIGDGRLARRGHFFEDVVVVVDGVLLAPFVVLSGSLLGGEGVLSCLSITCRKSHRAVVIGEVEPIDRQAVLFVGRPDVAQLGVAFIAVAVVAVVATWQLFEGEAVGAAAGSNIDIEAAVIATVTVADRDFELLVAASNAHEGGSGSAMEQRRAVGVSIAIKLRCQSASIVPAFLCSRSLDPE